jgi:hypothetical protein
MLLAPHLPIRQVFRAWWRDVGQIRAHQKTSHTGDTARVLW